MWRALSLWGVVAVGCTSGAEPAAPRHATATPPVVASASAAPARPPLPEGVYRLDGVALDLPSRDLAPLAALVGDRAIVGLGESIHASGGYYQAKARTMRYLIETLGFRVLAIEAGTFDSLPVTTYLETCEGTPEEAMVDIFPVYRDVSLAAFLRWACAFNREHPDDRIQLWGFDMQEPWQQMAVLRRFAASVAPGSEAYVTRKLADCVGQAATGAGVPASKAFWDTADGRIYTGRDPYPEARRGKCAAGLDAVRTWMQRAAPKANERTSDRDRALADIALVGLEGVQGQAAGGGVKTKVAAARDESMARIFPLLRSRIFPDDKVIVWAHNDHLAMRPGDTAPPGTSGAMLGRALRDTYGDDYFPIALIGYRVHVDWGKMAVPDPEVPTWEGDFETHLHALGEKALLVDLAPRDGAPSFFQRTRSHRIGWLQCRAEEQFRAAIYLDESPKMERIK